MPAAPQILPTQITQGTAPGLNYRLEGELVPVLQMALDGRVTVYFEHHVLLWKYPDLQIGMHPLKKGLKRRAFGGMPLLLLEVQSAGEIAFSRDAPGHIAALHIPEGHGIVVREHQFLAATGNVQYDYSRIKGFANMMYGGGFWVDEFFAGDHEGVVWVHGYGNVFERQLDPGESIDIEPGGWVYRDHSVSMSQEVYGSKTGFLGGGGNLVFNRFTGPGRVGLQSAYFHPPVQEGAAGNAQREGGGGLFGGGVNASRLLASVRALPPAGPPPDTQNPELMRQVLLALALRDDTLSGVEAAELADRALALTAGEQPLDPPAALEAAKGSRGN